MKIIQHPDGNQSVEATQEEIQKMETLLETRTDKLTPDSIAQMLRLIGDAYFTAGNHEAAVQWYARFVATQPIVPDGFLERVEMLAEEFPDIRLEGSASVLGERLMRARDDTGHSPEATAEYETGVQFAEEGEWASAVVCFEGVLAKVPQHYWAAHNLGAAYAELDDEAHALTWLRRAIGIDTEIPSAHYNLGLLLLRTGNPGLAIDALEQCQKLDAAYPGLDVVLGEALFANQEYEPARDSLARAAHKGEIDSSAWLILGRCYEALDQVLDAARAYRTASDLDPECAEAAQLLTSVQNRLH